MPKCLIVLTACVKPNTACSLTLTDVETRATQYLKALDWYFDNTDCDIVFAENSGYDTHIPDRIIKSPRFELLSWQEPQDEIDRGKGYKEALILERVRDCSRLFRNAEVIIKITGRLIVKNLPLLLKSLPNDFNTTDCCGQFERRFHRLDTRCLIAGKECFCGLLQFDDLITDNQEPHLIMEGAFALAITNQILNGTCRYIYPRYVFDYVGSGGGSGQLYTLSDKEMAKQQCLHTIAYPMWRLLATRLIVRNHRSWLAQTQQRQAELLQKK